MHNQVGPDRAMAYRVALGTGFRAKELRSLTPASFNLDGNPPTVTVQAAYSKRRRLDIQPIRSDLADILRPWLSQFDSDEHPFAAMPERTARMLRDDLDEARGRWLDEATTDAERAERERSDFLKHTDTDGRVIDFHAARHTYISEIVAGGASVKVAQELARHSTPVLTIGRYAHARLHDLTGALEALPRQTSQEPPSALDCQQATGTDGIECGERRGERAAGKTHRDVAQSGELSESSTEARNDASDEEDDGPNLLPLQDLARNDTQAAACGESDKKRMGQDSNLRWTHAHSGFQDREPTPKTPGKTAFPAMVAAYRQQ